MSRQIYLPELLSINIKNYTLYPNGLDYTFDFVKGVNLVLGGNGMGKTTFVNIIRFAILGLYKKPFGYTRTYQGNIIEKRQLFPQKYFSNRMDDSIPTDASPTVSISMKLNNVTVELTRDLSSITLTQLKVDGAELPGTLINQFSYEKLSDTAKINTLPYKYERIIKDNTNLEFDDLIFFVNEVLFLEKITKPSFGMMVMFSRMYKANYSTNILTIQILIRNDKKLSEKQSILIVCLDIAQKT